MVQMVEVEKIALSNMHIVERPDAPLADNAVRVRVESFAVTANNITYAVIGDMFGYWNFFPAAGGNGIVPMWGHGVVIASNHNDITVGERIYGYLPMGDQLDILPDNITASGFLDTTAHRQPMSPIYNQYSRLAADPEHDPAREDARMIYGPLFKTGFLIEAMFRRALWFGAEQLVMTSASSKTSMALASVARDKSPAIKRIGLTSSGNVAFVEQTGLYDQVLAYDAITTIAPTQTVSVDFAGNASFLAAIHTHLGDRLAYSCLVGATHVDGRGAGDRTPLAGPAPILFFAPDHATATIKDLGAKGFGLAVAESWNGFVGVTEDFMAVEHRSGLDAAREAFLTTLSGAADPSIGIVIQP